MRVVVLVKATADSEAGAMPSTEILEAMGRYNEELVEAGVMLSGYAVAGNDTLTFFLEAA